MIEEKRLTKITIENYDKIVSWEVPYNDVNLDDMFDAFVGLLTTLTWHNDSIIEFMKEYAEERLPNIEEESDTEEEC